MLEIQRVCMELAQFAGHVHLGTRSRDIYFRLLSWMGHIRSKGLDEYLKYIYIIKIKIHSSCEIEDFVETHLCKLCVILRSRALRVVCPH